MWATRGPDDSAQRLARESAKLALASPGPSPRFAGLRASYDAIVTIPEAESLSIMPFSLCVVQFETMLRVSARRRQAPAQ
ncbi:hypothetical protein DMO24_01610 [Modestobacter versicolor]|uniref:Uncharacterized protein n=1 Tax=Modestobacter versicolor TaxID=429133 RepID=A0A323VE07_9ACTN|nr:hypothetical protein DMO24_01610 [Modestobacter versicolor]